MLIDFLNGSFVSLDHLLAEVTFFLAHFGRPDVENVEIDSRLANLPDIWDLFEDNNCQKFCCGMSVS